MGERDGGREGRVYCRRVDELLESSPEIRRHWHWLDVEADVRALLQRYDALIHPSLYEGLPNVVAQVGAYRKGAKSVNPNIEIKVIYVQDMEDAAAAKEAALSLIAWGADYLSGKLNAGQLGIIQAAKEKGIHANGRSIEDTAIAPETVLTNIVEKWGEMYGAAGEAAKAGTLGGKFELYGLNSKGCTGAELQYDKDKELNPAVPADVVDALQEVKKKFASGDLKVSVTKEDARGGI